MLECEGFDFEDFSLVLSGGGALGIAHIGVLKELEKRAIYPSEIVGTSMGGIIGACLAIGLQVLDIYRFIEKFAGIQNWFRFSLSGNSIVQSRRIEEIFDKVFSNLKMKDAAIPLKIITTQLSTGRVKTFDKSDDIYIKDALLATMAIPGIFEEKEINSKIYVDGFLCENLGVNQATKSDVLALDVLGKNSFSKTLPSSIIKTKNIFDMFEKSLRILIYNQTINALQRCEKNVKIIDIDTKNYKTYHFHKYQEIEKLGEEAFKSAFL